MENVKWNIYRLQNEINNMYSWKSELENHDNYYYAIKCGSENDLLEIRVTDADIRVLNELEKDDIVYMLDTGHGRICEHKNDRVNNYISKIVGREIEKQEYKRKIERKRQEEEEKKQEEERKTRNVEDFIHELNELSEKYNIYIEPDVDGCGGIYFPYLINKNGNSACSGNSLGLDKDYKYFIGNM
jgi:uncharacterized FlaG/YvyC family protein